MVKFTLKGISNLTESPAYFQQVNGIYRKDGALAAAGNQKLKLTKKEVGILLTKSIAPQEGAKLIENSDYLTELLVRHKNRNRLAHAQIMPDSPSERTMFYYISELNHLLQIRITYYQALLSHTEKSDLTLDRVERIQNDLEFLGKRSFNLAVAFSLILFRKTLSFVSLSQDDIRQASLLRKALEVFVHTITNKTIGGLIPFRITTYTLDRKTLREKVTLLRNHLGTIVFSDFKFLSRSVGLRDERNIPIDSQALTAEQQFGCLLFSVMNKLLCLGHIRVEKRTANEGLEYRSMTVEDLLHNVLFLFSEEAVGQIMIADSPAFFIDSRLKRSVRANLGELEEFSSLLDRFDKRFERVSSLGCSSKKHLDSWREELHKLEGDFTQVVLSAKQSDNMSLLAVLIGLNEVKKNELRLQCESYAGVDLSYLSSFLRKHDICELIPAEFINGLSPVEVNISFFEKEQLVCLNDYLKILMKIKVFQGSDGFLAQRERVIAQVERGLLKSQYDEFFSDCRQWSRRVLDYYKQLKEGFETKVKGEVIFGDDFWSLLSEDGGEVVGQGFSLSARLDRVVARLQLVAEREGVVSKWLQSIGEFSESLSSLMVSITSYSRRVLEISEEELTSERCVAGMKDKLVGLAKLAGVEVDLDGLIDLPTTAQISSLRDELNQLLEVVQGAKRRLVRFHLQLKHEQCSIEEQSKLCAEKQEEKGALLAKLDLQKEKVLSLQSKVKMLFDLTFFDKKPSVEELLGLLEQIDMNFSGMICFNPFQLSSVEVDVANEVIRQIKSIDSKSELEPLQSVQGEVDFVSWQSHLNQWFNRQIELLLENTKNPFSDASLIAEDELSLLTKSVIKVYKEYGLLQRVINLCKRLNVELTCNSEALEQALSLAQVYKLTIREVKEGVLKGGDKQVDVTNNESVVLIESSSVLAEQVKSDKRAGVASSSAQARYRQGARPQQLSSRRKRANKQQPAKRRPIESHPIVIDSPAVAEMLDGGEELMRVEAKLLQGSRGVVTVDEVQLALYQEKANVLQQSLSKASEKLAKNDISLQNCRYAASECLPKISKEQGKEKLGLLLEGRVSLLVGLAEKYKDSLGDISQDVQAFIKQTLLLALESFSRSYPEQVVIADEIKDRVSSDDYCELTLSKTNSGKRYCFQIETKLGEKLSVTMPTDEEGLVGLFSIGVKLQHQLLNQQHKMQEVQLMLDEVGAFFKLTMEQPKSEAEGKGTDKKDDGYLSALTVGLELVLDAQKMLKFFQGGFYLHAHPEEISQNHSKLSQLLSRLEDQVALLNDRFATKPMLNIHLDRLSILGVKSRLEKVVAEQKTAIVTSHNNLEKPSQPILREMVSNS